MLSPATLELELMFTIHTEDIELTVCFPDSVRIIDEVTDEYRRELADGYVPESGKSPHYLDYDLAGTVGNFRFPKGILHSQSLP